MFTFWLLTIHTWNKKQLCLKFSKKKKNYFIETNKIIPLFS